MWPKFHKEDFKIIFHYLGVLVLGTGAAMLVPLLTAVFMGEWKPFADFVFGIAICLIIGSIFANFEPSPERLNSRQALMVTGLSYGVIAFVASIPLSLSGHFDTYLDALFDAMSGLTTTGLSLVQDLDHLSYSHNMWRFVTHIIGGQGVVVIALSLGMFGKSSLSTLMRAETRTDQIAPNVMRTTRSIMIIAFLITILAAFFFIISNLLIGIEPVRAFFDGLWMALTTYNTGGFASHMTNVVYYHSYLIELIAMVFMVLGVVSFALYAYVWRGNRGELFRNMETRLLVGWLTLVSIIFTVSLAGGTLYTTILETLRMSVFTVISAATSCGLQLISPNQMCIAIPSGALVLIILTMAIGTCSGSTAGGIKLFRIGIIFKSIKQSIKQQLSPTSAKVSTTYYHMGKQILTEETVKNTLVVFNLFMLTFIVLILAFIAAGFTAQDGVFAAISLIANGGMDIGVFTPELPGIIKIIGIIAMWAGRLEILTLLTCFAGLIVSIPRRRRQRD